MAAKKTNPPEPAAGGGRKRPGPGDLSRSLRPHTEEAVCRCERSVDRLRSLLSLRAPAAIVDNECRMLAYRALSVGTAEAMDDEMDDEMEELAGDEAPTE